jgi:predicted phosphodiesterase
MKEVPSVESQVLAEKKPFKPEVLAESLGVGVEVVIGMIEKLRDDGYTFTKSGEFTVKSKSSVPETVFDATKMFNGRHFTFGVISDTHLGNKQERVDLLSGAYDTFKKEGVRTIFHAGDMTDGWGVYKGQEFELSVLGQEAQIQYARDVYPKRYRTTTLAISGNHDLREYEHGGADPLVQICKQRPDIVYLGQMAAKVRMTEGLTAEILHPAGGSAYALSYKAQREINARSPDDIPDMLVYGHYHTSFYMHYRNLHFLQCPSLKDAGIWEHRLGLNSTLGFWIVNAAVSEDLSHFDRFQPELFTFSGKKK